MFENQPDDPTSTQSPCAASLRPAAPLRERLSRLRWFVPRNMRTVHHRLMARYLRRRGWTVFYLDAEVECRQLCWLRLYREEEKRVQ